MTEAEYSMRLFYQREGYRDDLATLTLAHNAEKAVLRARIAELEQKLAARDESSNAGSK